MAITHVEEPQVTDSSSQAEETRLGDSLSRAEQHVIAQTLLFLTLALNNGPASPDESAPSTDTTPETPDSLPSPPEPPTDESGTSPTNLCVVCEDSATVALPCGHHLDTTCLTQAYESAVRDEASYPPQCCLKPIPFATVARPHLPPALADAFVEREVEYTTQRRVYCASPTCSRFLGARDPDDSNARSGAGSTSPATVRTCPQPECGARTCGRCSGRVGSVPLTPSSSSPASPSSSGGSASSGPSTPRGSTNGNSTEVVPRGHTCTVDRSERHALAVAQGCGWVRCPGCEELVERTYGCFHMTCRCRTQFCYICRAPWKTCKCTRWTARAAAMKRQPVKAMLAVRRLFWSVPTSPAQIAGCRHTDLTRRIVGRLCQNCQMPFMFGYRCSDCRTVFCSDCKLKKM